MLRGLQDYDYTCRFEALRLACQHPKLVPASDLAALLPALERELWPSGLVPMTNAESTLFGMLYSLVQELDPESAPVAALCRRYELHNAFAVLGSAIRDEDLEQLDALLARGRPYEGRYCVLRPDRITMAATDVVAGVGFGLFRWAWPNGATSKVLARLVAAGMPVNEVVELLSPLHIAAEMGDVAAVELLLAAGANPNLESPLGETPTDAAVRRVYTGRPHGAEILACLEARGGLRAGSRASSKLAARSDEFLATLCRRTNLVADAAAVLAERRELAPRAYQIISEAIEEKAQPDASPSRGEWDPLVFALGQCPPRWLLCPAFFALHRGLDRGLARFAQCFAADPEAAAAGRRR